MSGLTITLPDDLVPALAQRVAEMAEAIVAKQAADSPWLDVAAAATYLCTSEQAIRAAVKRGQLPGKRPCGRVLFNREELDRYVRQGSA
jgi:excisionase family DNA binding protein